MMTICCSPRVESNVNPTDVAGKINESTHTSTISFLTDKGPVAFDVEVAKTPREREIGLMFRAELPEHSGMLFIFERDEIQSFWMKNTLISLDMIFMDSKWNVVGIVENAEPKSLISRSIGIPSKYVLEIRGGLAKKRGIKAGARAEFLGSSS